MTYINATIWFFFGVMVAEAADWLLAIWTRTQARHRRADATAVLKAHGLTPVLYLATIGVEDAGLRRALDEFTFSGYIIQTSEGKVMGRLVGSASKGPSRPHLRLVVSNEDKIT
ncbi:hypothetical protein [Acidithiobacillus ferriphilus]|uniref:hypothetical protein n=1 Tax=Acidithiobacillus ferriphilus TaxID=1689834 RepID=UPI001C60B769|nr:hypothetical protein [Acidithiobacillus ferriphilus]MEB8535132.1 hypothetical protein [Acidithiobacillus ferriphilus]